MLKLIKNRLKYEYLRELTTPTFIYFHTQTLKNVKDFSAFAEDDIDILYAIKANNHKKLVKEYVDVGYGFDVASREELEFVIKLGADPKKVSFSAPTKLSTDLVYASNVGVRYYAFDSELEVKKILANVKDPILFGRISTPSKDSVFDLSSKFGMTDDYYELILEKATKYKWPIEGLTFHVGSQNTALHSWEESLNKVSNFINLSKDYGIDINYLNLGGGLPVQYNGESREISYYINGIKDLAKKIRKKHKFKKIVVEPGRALSANTMILVTEVTNIKPYKHPPIIITNSSVFGGLIEPLEHFEYPIYHIDDLFLEKKHTLRKEFKIGGYSCDGYDIIKNSTMLPANIQFGDKLIITYAGAYTTVYEKFHMKPYPKIIQS